MNGKLLTLLNKLGLYTKTQMNIQKDIDTVKSADTERKYLNTLDKYEDDLRLEIEKTQHQRKYIQQLKQERTELKHLVQDISSEKERYRNRAKLADKDKHRLHRILAQKQKEIDELDSKYAKALADLNVQLSNEKSKYMAYVAMYDTLNTRYQNLAYVLALPYAMRKQALITYQRTYLDTIGFTDGTESRN